MIKIRADSIAEMIEVSVFITSPPQKIREAIYKCLQEKFSDASTSELAETAERLQARVVDIISSKQADSTADRFGYYYHLEIDDINRDYLKGSCFVNPGDDEDTKRSKIRRAKASALANYITKLSPLGFEKFCYRLLNLIGVIDPVVTRSSNDQGIDFFGEWHLEGMLKTSALPAGVERQFRTWIVGQAKKYDRTSISTAAIRELVGSVALAKAKTFSSEIDTLSRLNVRLCDPVFYMFVTTGRISSDVRRLLLDSGVLFMDSNLLGIFLADRAVDTDSWHSSEIQFYDWVEAVPSG